MRPRTSALVPASGSARCGGGRREPAAPAARLDAEGGAAFLRFAADPGRGLGPDAGVIVAGALSDRQLRRRLAHVRDAEAELALLRRMPASFRASPLGAD